MERRVVIDETRGWIAAVVIGLNLCPFAGRVFRDGKIRYAVSPAADEEALLRDLGDELRALAAAPIAELETTLLIHPQALARFLDYNDFLGRGERLAADLGLKGVIQIAGFHPDYHFAGTDPDAVENYTNRPPYPMLHLLREESISRVAGDPAELLAIPRRNIETLRSLGKEKLLEKLKSIRAV